MYGKKRRFGFKKKRATNFARATFTEMYDITTKKDSVTFLGIHTPNSIRPYQCLKGYFQQFKEYRVKSTDIYLVPGATLPIDPLSASIEAGDNKYSIKDDLNPIIHFGIPGGQSLGAVADLLFKAYSVPWGSSASKSQFPECAEFDKLYYQMLVSRGCNKSAANRGFAKKGCYPLINELAVQNPILPGETKNGVTKDEYPIFVGGAAGAGAPEFDTTNISAQNSLTKRNELKDIVYSEDDVQQYEKKGQWTNQIFTSRRHRMGWIDTLISDSTGVFNPAKINKDTNTGETHLITNNFQQWFSLYPKIYMYGIILPPMYNFTRYFRLIVKHNFEFRGFHNTIGLWNTEFTDFNPLHTDEGLTLGADKTLKNTSVEAYQDSAEIEKVMESVS